MCNGSQLSFTHARHLPSGHWSGYRITVDPKEIKSLLDACAKSKTIREITSEEFQALTNIPQEATWKVSDFMPEPLAVENLVPTVLPEKCFRPNRIIHCVERHKQKDDEALRRVRFARDSWVRIYMTGEVVPCHVWKYKRSALEIGDKRDLPYLKDVLEEGINRSTHGDDIILLTNDDTVLHPDLATIIFEYIEKVPVVCSGRLNYKFGALPTWKMNPNGAWGGDIGRDLFAFRKKWLKANWQEIPDFILGELEWDLVLSGMIRKRVGRETMDTPNWRPTKDGGIRAREIRNPKCELPPGYVWHEDHEKPWRDMGLFYSPAKRHNVELMQQWYQKNNLHHLITVV